MEKNQNPSPALRLVSGGKKIMIEALDGKAYISKTYTSKGNVFSAKKTFKLHMERDFKNWGLNQPGSSTAETLLAVSEMISDGTFFQLFTGINSDLDKIVMTQSQVIRFCEKHSNWLCWEGYATLFLTKANDDYFVLFVYVNPHIMFVGAAPLEGNYVCCGKYPNRLVYPITPLAEKEP